MAKTKIFGFIKQTKSETKLITFPLNAHSRQLFAIEVVLFGVSSVSQIQGGVLVKGEMCEDRSIWEIEKESSKCGLTFDKIWLDGDITLAGERERLEEKRKRKRKRKGRINPRYVWYIEYRSE